MFIFVINSGSSSIKYQLFNMPATAPVCSGLVERIGLAEGIITHKTYLHGTENVIRKNTHIANHEEGLYAVAGLLVDEEVGVIGSPDEIVAVGHRVVHGGEDFAATTIITEAVKAKVKELFSLAPLHNPPNYLGIEVAEKIFAKATQVGVFDTAFHQTLPPVAFRYAIPKAMYKEHGIRAYGFHGTSHLYVSKKAAEYLNNKAANIITIHLGNGCSMAAVKNGQSIDTTMGFGPIGGLVMGTRCGDIDASIIFHLVEQLGYTAAQVSHLLNKESGMLGMTGFSDMRDVRKAVAEGKESAILASELYAYRIKKYIGAYAAILNGLDAIVFTAGVGENDEQTRQRVCENLEYLGIRFSKEANESGNRGIREINTADSKVKILVIPTNEELEIARQCFELLDH